MSTADVLGLEAGEQLLAKASASFSGAATSSVRATFAFGSARHRNADFAEWRAAAGAIGFPTAGPEMVLCLTNRRLIVCRTSFWLNRPAGIAGSLPLSDIADLAIVRHGLITGLAFAITHRGLVQVEALRGRQLRRFATAVEKAIAERAP
jgi:hypothetical protein